MFSTGVRNSFAANLSTFDPTVQEPEEEIVPPVAAPPPPRQPRSKRRGKRNIPFQELEHARLARTRADSEEAVVGDALTAISQRYRERSTSPDAPNKRQRRHSPSFDAQRFPNDVEDFAAHINSIRIPDRKAALPMRIEIDQLALTGEGYLAPSDIHEEREVLKTNYTHAELMVPALMQRLMRDFSKEERANFAMTCKSFYEKVGQETMMRDVTLSTPEQALKFAQSLKDSARMAHELNAPEEDIGQYVDNLRFAIRMPPKKKKTEKPPIRKAYREDCITIASHCRNLNSLWFMNRGDLVRYILREHEEKEGVYKALESLESLHLGGTQTVLTDTRLKWILNRTPNLKEISLLDCYKFTMKSLEDIAGLPFLEVVDLSCTHFSTKRQMNLGTDKGEGIKKFLTAMSPRLKSLKLSPRLRFDTELLQIIFKMPKLETLHISNIDCVNKKNPNALDGLRDLDIECTNLKCFVLKQSNTHTYLLGKVARACPNLTGLHIIDNGIIPREDLDAVRDAALPNLKELRLEALPMKVGMHPAVAELIESKPTLTKLKVLNHPMKGIGKVLTELVLQSIMKLQRVRHLIISYSSALRLEDWQQLATHKGRPFIEIHSCPNKRLKTMISEALNEKQIRHQFLWPEYKKGYKAHLVAHDRMHHPDQYIPATNEHFMAGQQV